MKGSSDAYVTGTLSDLTANNDNTALLRLKNVDCVPFAALRNPNLYVHRPFQFTVPMTKEQALSYKAGYAVVLTGCPVFHPGAGMLIANGLVLKPSVTCFMMPVDLQCVGSLMVTDVKYDIFDSKAETVQKRSP